MEKVLLGEGLMGRGQGRPLPESEMRDTTVPQPAVPLPPPAPPVHGEGFLLPLFGGSEVVSPQSGR